MKALRQIKKVTGDKIFLDIPKSFQGMQVEIIILPYYSKIKNKKYNFSHVAGKLKWDGDAVKEQRGIRDEWE
ncbi:MAG: hypothetical protein JRJ44_06585 [Deltaproteobacteria bacterium]|nr:hypothetical protein [Deltaproteobacteria bacterium]